MVETTEETTRALLTEEARQVSDYVRAIGLALALGVSASLAGARGSRGLTSATRGGGLPALRAAS